MSLFNGKTLLITGGTGSFGNAVLNRFLRTDIGEIRIFSRDEKKQDDMRHEFQAKMPDVAEKIKFYIGDVRDFATMTFSIIALEVPIALTGYAALSVDRHTTFLTPASMAAVSTFSVPMTFVFTASMGKNSQDGTCLSAAAWNM